jgi:glucosamine--fructose-6-phosphate aminotransferase (isomerizing)
VSTWYDESFPELRTGPPWVMEEMVDAERTLPSAIADSAPAAARIAETVRSACERREPVVVTGCGTSEHAAQGIAELLCDAIAAPVAVARQALEAAASPRPGGVCIAVSHEGETAATIAALAAARREGAATVLVTAGPTARAARHADLVLDTPLVDRSWCHTVGYISPLLAGGLISAALTGDTFDAEQLELFLRGLRAQRVEGKRLGRAERLIAAGAGPDRVTARELALKVAEGARIPTAAYELENVLHGHLVAHDAGSALVVVATGPVDELASRRARQVVVAAARIGIATAAIASPALAGGLGADLVVPFDTPTGVPPLLGRLLGGALALQLVTLALVRVRGVNPDLLRRDEAPYREAAALGEKRTAAVFLDSAE